MPQRPSPSRSRTPSPLVSRAQLVAYLGVNLRTVLRWEEHEGLPVAVPGGPGRPTQYEMPAVLRWYVQRAKAGAAAPAPGGVGAVADLDTERARLAAIQRRRTELDVQQREGDLVPRAEIAAAWAEILGAVRAGLLALPAALAEPATLAAREGPRAVEALLRDRVTAALKEAAAWRPPGSEQPAEQTGATA